MPANFKQSPGKIFFLVGNSGSGKDSLIGYVLEHWPTDRKPLYVPTRVITRPPSPETEKYESITPEEFQELKARDEFTFWWKSYELHYGVRRIILDKVRQGSPVLINVSRQIIAEARTRFENLRVIFVRVPLEITMQRVKDRGREESADLEKRIERARKYQEMPGADYLVENAGKLEDAGRNLLEYLLAETEA